MVAGSGLESERPRRILALSGGGVRGIVEVAFLEAIEAAYRERNKSNEDLSDLFDIMGGTSTGALIATALSLGLPLSDIKDFYLDRARRFFGKRRWWAIGQAAAFDGAALERELREVVGDVTLGDAAFKTHLAIVTKRLDTGSPWILNNIPSAPYFHHCPQGSFIGNKEYSVARLLRAATAAPMYFDQQVLEVGPEETAVFVDGGLSPYNDPSFALLQLARLKAFGLNWPTGVERLFILSIGAGRFRERVAARIATRANPLRLAYLSMRGMVGDGEIHTLSMMQMLGHSLLPHEINSEIGALADDQLADDPLFSYLRLDLPLEAEALADVGLDVSARDVRRFHRFDDPEIIKPLYELTKEYAKSRIDLSSLIR